MMLGRSCRRVRPALVDLAVGTLSRSDVPRVEAHVATCATCRADLDAMREISEAFAAEAAPAVPEDFWRRQRQAIMRRVRTAPPPARVVPARMGRWQLAGAAATVLLAVLVSRSIIPLRPAVPHTVDHLDDDALLHLHDLLPAVAPASTIDDADGDVLSLHDLPDDELDSLADLLDNAS